MPALPSPSDHPPTASNFPFGASAPAWEYRLVPARRESNGVQHFPVVVPDPDRLVFGDCHDPFASGVRSCGSNHAGVPLRVEYEHRPLATRRQHGSLGRSLGAKCRARTKDPHQREGWSRGRLPTGAAGGTAEPVIRITGGGQLDDWPSSSSSSGSFGFGVGVGEGWDSVPARSARGPAAVWGRAWVTGFGSGLISGFVSAFAGGSAFAVSLSFPLSSDSGDRTPMTKTPATTPATISPVRDRPTGSSSSSRRRVPFALFLGRASACASAMNSCPHFGHEIVNSVGLSTASMCWRRAASHSGQRTLRTGMTAPEVGKGLSENISRNTRSGRKWNEPGRMNPERFDKVGQALLRAARWREGNKK